MKPLNHVRLYQETHKGKPTHVVEWRERPGRRERRRFADPDDAAEHAGHVERMCKEGFRVLAKMTQGELAQLAMMLHQLPGVSPFDIVADYKQRHHIEPLAPQMLIEAATAQFALTRQDRERFSIRQEQSVRYHMAALARHFPNKRLDSFSVIELEEYVTKSVGGAPKTRKNHVTTIRSFGRWCRTEKKWLPRAEPSAFEEVKLPRVKSADKAIYSPEELTRLLVFCPREMLPFLVIGAFGLMRAAERERLEGRHWQPEHNQFSLTNDITKTSRRRIVGAEPNLIEWMKLIPVNGGTILTGNSPYRQTARIAKAANVAWKQNALRSSGISYHLQKYKNPALTAMKAGHSVQEMERSYKGIENVNDTTADAWWSITPSSVRAYALQHALPAPLWEGGAE